MNASPSLTHRTDDRRSSDYRTLKLFAIGAAQGVISQQTVSSDESWTGLSKSDAESLCISYNESTLNGVKRNYLGGVSLRIGGGGIYTSAECDECWGKRVTSSMQRIGDTNLYEVHRTTEDLTIYTSGGTAKLL